jgi:hypothetical protein
MYSAAAFVTLDNVKAPIENTIDPGNSGIFITFSYVSVPVLSSKLPFTLTTGDERYSDCPATSDYRGRVRVRLGRL